MSNTKITVRSIKERRFALIPVDKIVVVNPRDRNEEHFKEVSRSMDDVGLQKPICVNERNFARTGNYELVCGEGRLRYCQERGITHIEAEIVDLEEGHALLAGLAENFTRAKKNPIEIAKSIHFMYKKGLSKAEIQRATGRADATIDQYITLMEKGKDEERLIIGVEEGRYTICFAMQILECNLSDVRKHLMDEYDDGRITYRNLEYIMKLLDEREEKGLSNKGMDRKKLTGIINDKTRKLNQVISEMKLKQDDAVFLSKSLNTLWNDENFSKMADSIRGLPKPKLRGQYSN